jgi:predicted RND superfamily exporter protein
VSLARRLADLQVRYARAIVLAGAITAALALTVVRGLPLANDWSELLPSTAPSVRDLRAGEGRVGGLSTLTLVVTSRDLAAMQRFAADAAPRLERLAARGGVRRVEWNVRDYQRFVRAHAALYAPAADLRAFRDALAASIEDARQRANPLYAALDDPPPDPTRTLARSLARLDAEARGAFPDGYFVHRNRRILLLFLRCDVAGGDAAGGHAIMNAARAVIDALGPARYAPDLRVEFAGDVPIATTEHDSVVRELVLATTLTLLLCGLAVYGLFRRARAIAQLGATLAVPVLVTFAFARLAVGHLNTSTAFLGSIIVGNGVNPGIVWLARYFEERRGGATLRDAIATAHANTWAGTLAASCAAALSYGSLAITDFRGFRDFGVIGGVGMLVCWAFTVALLPATTAAWESVRPLRLASHAAPAPYATAFARLTRVSPRATLGVCVALALAGAAAAAVAVARDPLEYDFRKLMSVRDASSRASYLNGLVSETVGRTGSGNAIAMLAERSTDVAPLRAALERGRAAPGGAPYGPVRTLDDLLPDDQTAKLALLVDVRRLLLDLRPHVAPDVQRRIDENLPPAAPQALTADALPLSVAALFSERDGTRGRILFVEERADASTWDGRYLVAWARAIRAVRTPDGRAPLVVGRAPIFADMISAIGRDGPRAVLASLAATVLLVALAFRSARPQTLTLAALAVGVAWMCGALTLLRIRLNFLNFVALPITFGIGADYAINVTRRYVIERADHPGVDPDEALRRTVSETGGAIVVCSLTTIFGYGSLFTSANRALNSFGLAAALGEVACLLAAMIALPAMLAWPRTAAR